MSDYMQEISIDTQPESVSLDGTEIILKQMKKNVCKIYKKNGSYGTGFFCKIPFLNKTDLPVLITNNHVLNEKEIDNNQTIELEINGKAKTIKIENSRKKFTDKI